MGASRGTRRTPGTVAALVALALGTPDCRPVVRAPAPVAPTPAASPARPAIIAAGPPCCDGLRACLGTIGDPMLSDPLGPDPDAKIRCALDGVDALNVSLAEVLPLATNRERQVHRGAIEMIGRKWKDAGGA